MQKLVKYLALFSVFLSSIAILNGIICAFLLIIDSFMPYRYALYSLSTFFYVAELILGLAAVVFILLQQSLWILLQISKK